MTKSLSRSERSSFRRLTIDGETAMTRAQEEGRMIIDAHASEFMRTYVATGLLMAALEELQDGVARESAADMMREVLIAMSAPRS